MASSSKKRLCREVGLACKKAQCLCCLPSSNGPAPPEMNTIVGQPVEMELIAKEENKIQIFISHNCILDLGLDPVEAESP